MKLAGLTAACVGSVAGLGGTATAEENKQNTRCDGLVTVEGGETVEETGERIEVAIEEAESELIMTFDHAANAESVGEGLRETILILLGAPTVGTPIMQENQTARSTFLRSSSCGVMKKVRYRLLITIPSGASLIAIASPRSNRSR